MCHDNVFLRPRMKLYAMFTSLSTDTDYGLKTSHVYVLTIWEMSYDLYWYGRNRVIYDTIGVRSTVTMTW